MTSLQTYTSKELVQSSIPIIANSFGHQLVNTNSFGHQLVPMTSRKIIDASKMPAQNWTIFAGHSELSFPHISQRTSDAKASCLTLLSLEERLFDNAAELKIALSEITMHLAPEWRTFIRRSIDFLLDLDSWQDDDSAFIQKPTFTTFLRFITFAKPTRLPSLGVGLTGNILAAWYEGNQRVTVEFFPKDKAAATFVKQGVYSGEREALAWRGNVADLKPFIGQNGMIGCLLSDQA